MTKILIFVVWTSLDQFSVVQSGLLCSTIKIGNWLQLQSFKIRLKNQTRPDLQTLLTGTYFNIDITQYNAPDVTDVTLHALYTSPQKRPHPCYKHKSVGPFSFTCVLFIYTIFYMHSFFYLHILFFSLIYAFYLLSIYVYFFYIYMFFFYISMHSLYTYTCSLFTYFI